MGSQLVTEAFSAIYSARMDGCRLSNRAAWVLVVMAHRSMDGEGRTLPARTYARGWEWLAREAFGYRELPRNGAGYRQVARAISELTERKLIRVADTQVGAFTRYEILPPL